LKNIKALPALRAKCPFKKKKNAFKNKTLFEGEEGGERKGSNEVRSVRRTERERGSTEDRPLLC